LDADGDIEVAGSNRLFCPVPNRAMSAPKHDLSTQAGPDTVPLYIILTAQIRQEWTAGIISFRRRGTAGSLASLLPDCRWDNHALHKSRCPLQPDHGDVRIQPIQHAPANKIGQISFNEEKVRQFSGAKNPALPDFDQKTKDNKEETLLPHGLFITSGIQKTQAQTNPDKRMQGIVEPG
jgi:hypothetical protein